LVPLKEEPRFKFGEPLRKGIIKPQGRDPLLNPGRLIKEKGISLINPVLMPKP